MRKLSPVTLGIRSNCCFRINSVPQIESCSIDCDLAVQQRLFWRRSIRQSHVADAIHRSSLLTDGTLLPDFHIFPQVVGADIGGINGARAICGNA
jgi:hypothetical protein